MRWLLTGLLVGVLALLMVVPDVEAQSSRRRRASSDDQVPVKVVWTFGADRRGEILFRVCSDPDRNTKTSGDCYVTNVLNEPLTYWQGERVLQLREGYRFNICFVAQDTVGRPGRWGACRVVTAISDVVYRFDEDDLTFWFGGTWREE